MPTLRVRSNISDRASVAIKLNLSLDEVPTGATLTLKLSVTPLEGKQVIAEVIPAPSSPKIGEPPIDRLLEEVLGNNAESWTILLKRLDLMVRLGDQLAEVSA